MTTPNPAEVLASITAHLKSVPSDQPPTMKVDTFPVRWLVYVDHKHVGAITKNGRQYASWEKRTRRDQGPFDTFDQALNSVAITKQRQAFIDSCSFADSPQAQQREVA